MNAASFPPFSNPEPPPAQNTTPEGVKGEVQPASCPRKESRRGLLGWIQENTFAPEWLPERLSHPLIGYLAAALIIGVSSALALLLLMLFPSFAFHGILVLIGVVLVAMGWGAGPGLFATLLGTFALYFVVLSPGASGMRNDEADGVGLAMYLLVGVSISLLAGQNERSRRTAEETTRLLTWAESRSRYEAERLRTVLEVLPTAVLITGKQGELLAVNQATRILWGGDVPLGTNIMEFPPVKLWRAQTGQPVPPEEWPLVHTLGTGQVVQNDEFEFEGLDGRRKFILKSTAPLRDEAGAVTGAVISAQDISDLRRLEREVSERAQELEAVFEAMTDGVFVFDATGRIDRVNAAGRWLLGLDVHPYSRAMDETAYGRSPRDRDGRPLPLEHVPGIRILRGEVLTGAQAVDVYFPAPERGLLALNTSGTPLRNAEGTITGAVVVTRDVTERHRLEREAAERAQELEAVFEAMTDGLAVLDTQGRILRTNQAFRTLHGVGQDSDFLTLPLEERFSMLELADGQGRSLAIPARPISRMLQGETLAGVDVTIKRLDGREIVLSVGGAPIWDHQGQVSGCVEVFRDVTARHHLEERTHDTLDALVAMAEAIVTIRPTTRRLDPEADPASSTVAAGTTLALVARHLAQLTQSALGCSHVSLLAHDPTTGALHPLTTVGLPPGQQRAWWACWSSPQRLEERFGPAIAATLAAGAPAPLDAQHLPEDAGSILEGAHSGRIVPMRLGEELVGVLLVAYAEPDHVFSGEELALTGTLARLGALVLERDQLLRGWAETRASELALAETKAQMDTFLGIASHELKTPLTSLKLSLQLAERRLQALIHLTQEEVVAAIGTIQAVEHARLVGAVMQLGRTTGQMERMERLVNDLVDVSRIQAGKLELHPRPANLLAIVREAVVEQREAVPDRRIQFLFPVDQVVAVEVDAGRIEQVVTNFLTNALKYSPADRPVEVGMEIMTAEGNREGTGKQARIWVRDEGPGLPPEEQEQIWEQFHRVKGVEVQSGAGVGLGLGLHISRMIVERHQGQVGVESALGQGSTFWFTLPLPGPTDKTRYGG